MKENYILQLLFILHSPFSILRLGLAPDACDLPIYYG
jgi:hypothetical protein